MSFDDDLEPQHQPKGKAFPQANVEALSIEELKAYIEHANNEIARAKAEISAKESLRGDADALFRK